MEDVNFPKINSMKLIELVRQNEVLYNSQANGYNDKNIKDASWELVYNSLFSKYHTYDPATKDIIRENVRRRWKTLRNSISREVKKSATITNYCRKKESPIIGELEFLIPHIKSAYCAKIAGALSQRESYYPTNGLDEPDDDDSSDLIDLTEDIDIKPDIKFETSFQIEETDIEPEFDSVPAEALYPKVQMVLDQSGVETQSVNVTMPVTQSVNVTTMPVTPTHSNVNERTAIQPYTSNNTDLNTAITIPDWSKEYCTVAEYKEGEFTNSTPLLCPNADDDIITSIEVPECKSISQIESRKRPRTSSGDSTELQAKILQLLTNLHRRERADIRSEEETQDEDRMFLLSLVSDIKRVPAAKKMNVKAEITNAIAHAIDHQ